MLSVYGGGSFRLVGEVKPNVRQGGAEEERRNRIQLLAFAQMRLKSREEVFMTESIGKHRRLRELRYI